MSLVIVEREFAEPVEFAELQAREERGKWCLDQHDVRFIRSFFALDRKRMACLYEAPDAEAVRAVQRTIDMPVTRVWAATALRKPPELPLDPVVVERQVASPVTPEMAAAMAERGSWCFEAHRIELIETYLSFDGMRTVCLFRAPDAESVRTANRQAALPIERAWAARLYG
jgi:hypothetical protein